MEAIEQSRVKLTVSREEQKVIAELFEILHDDESLDPCDFWEILCAIWNDVPAVLDCGYEIEITN